MDLRGVLDNRPGGFDPGAGVKTPRKLVVRCPNATSAQFRPMTQALISAPALRARLASGAPCLLVDCRFDLADPAAGERQHAQARLPGAVYLHLDRDLSAAKAAGAVTMNIGLFINAVISFLIVAFAVFLLIKGINNLQREKEAPPAEPTTKDCAFCFTAIPIKATRCPHCTSQLE